MVREPGRPGEPNQPVPEDTESGATWRLIVGDTGRAKHRGNLRLSQPAPPKDARIEATRRSIAGKAGDEEEGQPEDSSEAGKGVRTRATWNLISRCNAEASEVRGNSNVDSRHSRKAETRGNPRIGRPRGQRARGTGQPGDANLVERDESGSGATCKLNERLTGRCMIR